jgi:hypothetical protein
MDSEHEQELERADTWDFEHPEVRRPVKPSRVIVSVAFRRDDFHAVAAYAKRLGKKTSEFIREVAMEKATGRDTGTLAYGSGSAGSQWWIEQVPASTLASGSPVEPQEEKPALTH